MKKLLLVLLFISFTSICSAELYVIIDKDTEEVITASDKNDTIVQVNQELKVLSGSISDFTDENPTNYKLINNKFIKNINKIDEQERAKIIQEEKVDEEIIIQEEIRQTAIKSLQVKGIELKHNKVNDE